MGNSGGKRQAGGVGRGDEAVGANGDHARAVLPQPGDQGAVDIGDLVRTVRASVGGRTAR